MGYHVIYNTNSKSLNHQYVETEDELLELPLRECVIYEGIKEWSPKRLGDNKDLEILTKDWYKTGRKAERVFYELAKDKYIIEPITQDLLSYESYRNSKGEWLKRGDFLLRDVFNMLLLSSMFIDL